jgi:hypothetical protein
VGFSGSIRISSMAVRQQFGFVILSEVRTRSGQSQSKDLLFFPSQ